MLLIALSVPIIATGQAREDSASKPNVLFIALDDLNDWVGVLGGHPQAKTPNIDRLAKQGVLFEQAYCAAPLCNPSRTAVMTGLRSSTTGVYGNTHKRDGGSWFRNHPEYKDWVTLPQYFRQHGYVAWGGGKIFHASGGQFSDPISWDHQYSTKVGTPTPKERYLHGLQDKFSYNPIVAMLNDWAPIEESEEETSDWDTAEGAAAFLQQDHDKPFFLAAGIFRPHLPWYAPQKYFDMHPIEDILLPPYLESDLDDVPQIGRNMSGRTFDIIKENGQWKSAVQGYLASTSFADACLGVILDSLESSQYRDNTIVVLWGDHGYAIGEKHHFSKSALWEATSKTTLIIKAPGVSMESTRSKRTVSLVDLYPTLIELAGLPARDDLDGRSIAPLVRDPGMEWPYPAVVTHSPPWHGPNHAVRSEQYHYINYSDGGEELYDVAADPNGWTNLANDPEHAEAKADLKTWLPKIDAEPFPPNQANTWTRKEVTGK
jgi:arylsulfatase A-like enzyme